MRSHVEKSKKYELDRFLIKKIYNIKDKKKRVYNLSKKNVVYDKQLTEQYYKYSNNNRNNYYSSYQSFRDYISSGYNYDFLLNEINNVKSILGFSRNIREIIEKKINPDTSSSMHNISNVSNVSNKNKIIEEESNSNERIHPQNEDPFAKIKKIPTQNQNQRRASTVFQIDKENPYIKRVAELTHKNIQLGPNFQSKPGDKKDFLEVCKLLKLKKEEEKYPQNQYQFRLFSVMTEDFDPFYLPMYENFMTVKYENQKTKLIKLYNQENAFVECVTVIKSKLKLHLNKSKNKLNNINNLNNNNANNNILKSSLNGLQNFPQHKLPLKIPYINAFYFGRTEAYFKNIDNFMSMYKENISLSSKKLEKDFFANLFKILTFNNTDCKKFLQYLYTHSYFFKYIYNIFTFQNKWTDMNIKNFAPSIKKNNEEEHFLNDSMKQLFFTEDSKNVLGDDNKLILNKEDNLKIGDEDDIENEIDYLLGNDFIYKINLCEEDVSEYIKEKNIEEIKKMANNAKNFNHNYIITFNNSQNLLQVINSKKGIKQNKKRKSNLKNNKYLISVNFDEKKVVLNELKNIEIEKDKKNTKLVLIALKQNKEYTQAYIFKISKDIYNRLKKSIELKGSTIYTKDLFKDEDNDDRSLRNSDLENIVNNANDEDESQKSGKKNSSKENLFDFGSRDSDKKKKEKEDSANKETSKAKIRRAQKQLTFAGDFGLKKDNLNESDKNDENEDEDKSDNKDSSEVKSSAEEKESEEKEDEEEEESDGEEDEKDEKGGEGGGDNDDDGDEDEDSDEKKDNKKEEEIKDKSEDNDGSGSISGEIDLSKFKNQNEEEINTDLNKNKEDKKMEDDNDIKKDNDSSDNDD